MKTNVKKFKAFESFIFGPLVQKGSGSLFIGTDWKNNGWNLQPSPILKGT